jgi:hypothetical protein
MRDLEKEAQETEEPETLFNRQQTLYHTNAAEWWCGCPAYQFSTFHLCKHLIRFLSAHKDPTGQRFVFQPFHGLVHRQTTSPLLWIQGFHDEDQRTYRGVDDNFRQPTAEELLNERQPNRQPRIDPPASGAESDSSSDSDSSTSSDSSSESTSESDDDSEDAPPNNNPQNGDPAHDMQNEPVNDTEDIEMLQLNEDEEEQLEEQRAGEELKTHLRIFLAEVDVLKAGIVDMLEYEPGHRHLREAPPAGVQHATRWMRFIERKRTLLNLRGLAPTFDRRRRDLIFSSQ